jgi:hypothetical protein
MRLKSFLSLALGAIAAAPSVVRAQTVPSPYRYLERAQSVGLHAGYISMAEGNYQTNPTSGPLVELRYNGRFAGPVSAVGTVGLIPSDRPVYTRAGKDATAVRLGDASSLLAIAEAGLKLSITGPRSWRGLQPFITTTGGIVTNLAGRTDEEAELAGDHLWRRRVPAGLTDSGTREAEWSHNVALTVGAALHF